jgi:hypothetical protein
LRTPSQANVTGERHSRKLDAIRCLRVRQVLAKRLLSTFSHTTFDLLSATPSW